MHETIVITVIAPKENHFQLVDSQHVQNEPTALLNGKVLHRLIVTVLVQALPRYLYTMMFVSNSVHVHGNKHPIWYCFHEVLLTELLFSSLVLFITCSVLDTMIKCTSANSEQQ